MKQKIKIKLLAIILTICLAVACFTFSACSGDENKPNSNGSGSGNAVDIDLTSMNSTMVYAYVNDMVNEKPESYLGKTIKVKGVYYKSYFSTTDQYYYYILINDATVCCTQGIEFIYEGSLPAEDTEIILKGVFMKYLELGTTYYYIAASSLSVA